MQMANMQESGFELAIDEHLVSVNGFERANIYGTGEYNTEYAVDESRLFRFLQETQPEKVESLHILESDREKSKFLVYLSKEICKGGIIKILRHGVRYNHELLDFYYPLNTDEYADNIWSVTRQLRYAEVKPHLALDMAIFLNGLPIITLELKNGRNKWSTVDAVEQYRRDRSPKDAWNVPLFNFKKCLVHFAVDTDTVMMCTRLVGEESWFLPFNKGDDDGAGNPPNECGFKTDYLWKNVITKDELSNIIQNFALYSKKEDKQIFPRWHQLQTVKSLLTDVVCDGVGHRYLIQHSAGSGKSNSIAWLALQLVPLKKDGALLFDSVIIVTDRVNLDKQIKSTVREFADEGALVGWARNATELKDLLTVGKKIIITVIHKFDKIVSTIGKECKGSKFAIIIDEAHSSQNGRLSAKMSIVVSGNEADDEDYFEDKINALIKGRKMAGNASYFAFTATPKNKTLENFGREMIDRDGVPIRNDNDERQFEPHYVYTMKQAIEEGYILDVVRNYSTYESYYKLVSKVEGDPRFNAKKAQGILRFCVESSRMAVEEKARVIVEHFIERVKQQIGGKARAMVVTQGIPRAIEYYKALSRLLTEMNSPFKAIVAFSGEFNDNGQMRNEASYNGFVSSGDTAKGTGIEGKFKNDPYRILIVADKFQTGFDEPLLQTMYVDKVLTDIKAVQTLSRLNRAHPGKKEPGVFVLDFMNDISIIKKAFDRYYRTTILSGETDPNKLNALIDSMEVFNVYTQEQINEFVRLLFDNQRELLEPILNTCKEKYKALEIDEQIKFKNNAKTFIRTYHFLAAILPYGSQEWEKLSIFLNVLIGILPPPGGDDGTRGLWESVDLVNYRSVAQQTMKITLDNENATIAPIPVLTEIGISVPEFEPLSKILEDFHKRCESLGINIKHKEEVDQLILDLPEKVKRDDTYQAAMTNSDEDNSRIEAEKVTKKTINNSSEASYELQRAISTHPDLLAWLVDYVFRNTYFEMDKNT